MNAVTALSSTDVWAVGEGGFALNANSWHWNGQHWKHVPVPQNLYQRLYAVAASSPDNVWSVGVSQGDGAIALAEHWNGTQWKDAPPRNRPRNENGLSGVVMTSAQTLWAVGYYGHYGKTYKTLIEYYC